jgi:hypothetical protein
MPTAPIEHGGVTAATGGTTEGVEVKTDDGSAKVEQCASSRSGANFPLPLH